MPSVEGQGATPQKGNPSVTPEVGIQLLSQQILKGEQLFSSATRDDGRWLSDRITEGEEIVLLSAGDFDAWNNATHNYIEKAFGENHGNVENFDYSEGSTNAHWNTFRWSEHYVVTIQRKIAVINGYIEELRTEILIRQWNSLSGGNIEPEPSKKVFIVHGHNDKLKYEIAHSLQRGGLDVTILHEQANKGRTMLAKFADHAQDAFYSPPMM